MDGPLVVANVDGYDVRTSDHPTKECSCASDPASSTSGEDPAAMATSLLDYLRSAPQMQQLSASALQSALSGYADGGHGNHHERQFVAWCGFAKQHKMRATNPSVTDVMKYVQAIVDNEINGINVGSYSAVRNYVAAINVTMQRRMGSKDYDLHANPMFNQFMASIKRRRPAETKYDTFFDPDKIFEYILTHWSDNASLDITTLRTKTLVLFRLYGFNRADDLAKSYKEQTTVKAVRGTATKRMTYRFGPSKNVAAMRKGRSMPKYTTVQSVDSPVNPALVGLSLPHAYEALSKRTAKTSAVIGPNDDKVHGPAYHGQTASFSSVTKQTRGPKDERVTCYIALTANTIGSLCLQVMKDAGIDTVKYKAHALRGASGNRLLLNGGTKTNWLSKTRHCKVQTLDKFYVRDIDGTERVPAAAMPKLPPGYTDVDIQLRFVGLSRKAGAVTRSKRKRSAVQAAVSQNMTT